MRRIFPQGLLKHFEKCLRRLRARECWHTIYDKEGNSLKAQLESSQRLFIHFLFACFAVQKCPRIGLGKAHFGGDFGQNVVSTYVAAFGEISPEECFRKMILMILLFGPPQQPMSPHEVISWGTS